jgi:hypothetical protein
MQRLRQAAPLQTPATKNSQKIIPPKEMVASNEAAETASWKHRAVMTSNGTIITRLHPPE